MSFERLRELIQSERLADALQHAEDKLSGYLGQLNAEQLAVVADLLDRAGMHFLSDPLFRRLIAIAPDNQWAIYRYALAAFNQGDIKETLARGETIPLRNWRLSQAIELMARVAIKDGQHDKAVCFLEHGLSGGNVRRRDSLIQLAIQVAYWENNDPALVIDFHQAQPIGPDKELRLLAALAAGDIGQHRKALEILECYLKSGSECTVDALVCAYEVMRRAGETAAALQWLNLVFLSKGLSPLLDPGPNSCFKFPAFRCEIHRPPHCKTGQLVSVIMTMNRWNPLADTAIGSILEQTHANLELIIVVDGRPDSFTQSALRVWSEKDARIRVKTLDENHGTYVAKNYGIGFARGEFVAFMDSDDWSHPMRLERALKIFGTAPHELIAICDDAIRLRHNGSLAYRGLRLVKEAPISLVIKRRPMLGSVGYFDNVRCSGDSEYCARIAGICGTKAIEYTRTVTILQSFGRDCLTGGGQYAYDWRGLTGDRFKYVQSYRAWHKAARVLGHQMYISNKHAKRLFHAPASVLANPLANPLGQVVDSLPERIARCLPALSKAAADLDPMQNSDDREP